MKVLKNSNLIIPWMILTALCTGCAERVDLSTKTVIGTKVRNDVVCKLIFDAGSSGTRLFLYSTDLRDPSRHWDIVKGVKTQPLTNAFVKDEKSPTFAARVDAIGQELIKSIGELEENPKGQTS